jgi:nitrogen fixation/metabolism regulation signal transduction histidine kinase
VEQELTSILYTSLLLIFAIMLGTIIHISFVARSISRPLRKISDAVEELSLGHTDIDLPVGKAVDCSKIKNCDQEDCGS